MADEQRIQAYGALIEQLLNCPQGEEANILQNHPDLVDAGLLVAMEQVAVHLERQGNGSAQWLRGFATRLAETMNLKPSASQDLEAARQFLLETLQVIADKQGDPQQIYPLWEQQITSLNSTLLDVLPQVAESLYVQSFDQPASVATNLFHFGYLMQGFSDGTPWLNIEIAITAYELSLKVRTRDAFPKDWAKTQNNLANAYIQRVQGNRAENVETAISIYKDILQTCTRDTFAEDWARAQRNLAIVYRDRVLGDRAENLEQEITGYKNALKIYTYDDFPKDCATIQTSLAIAYKKRILGEHADNIEQSIAAYKYALRVYTREAFAEQWASTYNSLGGLYQERICGDKADNIETAIAAHQKALQIYTLDTFPEDWAVTHWALASQYIDRIQGERSENIEQAIFCYEQAFQIYTQDAFPEIWATMLSELAPVYLESTERDQVENVEQAIACYELALQVYTREAFPEDWARTQLNLALTYSERIRGDRAENIEQAIIHFKLALKVYTYEAFPQYWARTQCNLAVAYPNRIRGDREENIEKAIAHYELALQVYTLEAFPEDWATIQCNLAINYGNRIQGERADNLEKAIAHYELALQVYTREAFPEYWARIQNNLAAVASPNRIRGDRAENVEKEITHLTQAFGRDIEQERAEPTKTADAKSFLLATLQLVAESTGNPQQVYPMWTQQQAQINPELLAVLPDVADNFFAGEAKQRTFVADVLVVFGDLINQFPLGTRWLNLELAIAAYELALQVHTCEKSPKNWAGIQNNLAIAYHRRIRGERADNLERAIATYKLALQVYIREQFPEKWAMAQSNLASAYSKRIRGERADNLEQSIATYELTLQVYTREHFPQDWAKTQNNVANAYLDRIRGEHADNLERAIATYKLAFQVYTRQQFPEQWAATQQNLASAYSKRIRGERADNLEQAIAAYELALQVHTREQFPQDWAMTQGNLANVYRDRIRGERADNLEQAITACELALQVYTREQFPQDWAATQGNLGLAYHGRIRGEGANNLERAIAAYELALQVYTREQFPQDWASIQLDLANVYRDRIRGERADNLEQAIIACELALQVYTREQFPQDWAKTQKVLAAAYLYRIRGERADNIEQAITAYALALQVYTRENFPQNWAAMQNNLAHAYNNRIRGERADNIEQAITAYALALQVYRPDTLPDDCRRTARNLANLYSDLSRWSEAYATYQTALKAAELLYQSAYLLDGKSAELSATSNLPRRAAYALARAGDLQAAALTLEQGRARGLSETLERDRSDLTQLQLTNPDLFNQYQGITAQLRNLEAQQRSRITSEERHSLTPEAFRTTALRLRQTMTETIKQIRQVEGYTDFLAQPDFNDIQQAVRPDVPLVYLVPTPLGSLALMITLQTIEPIWLDDFPESKLRELLYGPADDPKLGGWFGAFQAFRNNSKANYSAWCEEIERSTCQLWEPLMAPLITHLKQHSFHQAILIPTGLLSFLPLHTAWTEDPSQPTGKRYAFDDIHFTYAPNAKSLTAAQAIAQQTPSDHILAIDNPGDDLPNSSREVTAAISTFPQSIVLPHNQATVAAVKAALPKTDIAHFSCHGIAKLTDPLTSGLLMSDGLITLRDLLDLKLSGDGGSGIRLAILSACETGLIGTELADEAISLPTGLLQAGVAGVIASLWAVSDLSTMLLLSKFYELWRTENKEPSEALRQAQIWLRDSTEAEIAPLLKMRTRNPTNRPFSHPYHWAAFSYTGL